MIGNVVVVCWRANRLKNSASIAEMRQLADFYDLVTPAAPRRVMNPH